MECHETSDVESATRHGILLDVKCHKMSYVHSKSHEHRYRKQQIHRGAKLSWFSWIFDKTRKFSLLVRSNMYCNLTKPRRFSLHSAKKPVNHKSFVPRRICCLQYSMSWACWLSAKKPMSTHTSYFLLRSRQYVSIANTEL